MRKIYLLSILLSGAAVFSLSAQSGLWTDEGNYSIDWFDQDYDPSHYAEYHLSSAADLAGLAYLSETATFKNKKIILDRDIDLSAHYWRPVGGYVSSSYYTPVKFAGKFDGGTHVIKHMQVEVQGKAVGDTKVPVWGGLFAAVSEATIQYLTLDSTCSVKVTVDKSGYDFSSVYGGGIAGMAINTLFVDCHNHASVEVRKKAWSYEEPSEGVYAGGIAGRLTGQILSSTNTGTIVGFVESNNANYEVQAGGLSGSIGDGINMDGRIAGCENQGTVLAVNLSATAYVGGIVGEGAGEIVRCTNSGEITVEGEENTYVGGMVGIGEKDITECINMGTIKAEGDNNAFVGGIAGWGEGSIRYNRNRGEIRSSASRSAYVGGIIGDIGSGAETWLSCCYNTGNVTCTLSTGESYCGGIVGLNEHTLINCGNSGHIRIVSAGNGPVYAGGIAGKAEYIIWNSYNLGKVEAVSEVQTADDGVWGGGIAGKCSLYSGLIINCYTTADVTASSSYKAYAGWMSGENFPYLSCYYLSDAVVSGTENILSAGIPLSREEMQGEDFAVRLNEKAAHLSDAMGWELRPGENDGYPVLKDTPAGMEYVRSDRAAVIFGTEGFLVIRASRPADYRIYDLKGIRIMTVHAEAGETRIALPSGIYLINSQIVRI